MKNIPPLAIVFLLAAPLMAQDQVVVTKAEGGPDTYVSLMQHVPVLNPPEIKGAITMAQIQTVMLEQSAVMHGSIIHGLPSGARTGLHFNDLSPKVVSSLTPAAASYTPPPFSSLANDVAFIQHQIATSIGGLPQTYYNPSGSRTGNQVVDNGIGTYDTSLALMALIQSGNLSQAQKILDIYNSGRYGPPPSKAVIPPAAEVLTAYPTSDNGGAFAPFDKNTYYYFDFADANAEYEPSWNQYGSHTGPNAYLALAACQFIDAEHKAGVTDAALAPYLAMVTRLGNAMIALQDDQTQGGVRYGPHASYEDPYNTINTENALDAYSAFNAIANVMQEVKLAPYAGTTSKYSTAAGKILAWLQNASVYNPDTGATQKGMLDPKTGLLYVGAVFQNNRWELQTQVSADSGGSLRLSALGPQLIDSLWGKGTAFAMWQAIRANFGRTEGMPGDPSTIHNAGPNDPLAGLDYSNIYPSNQALISPEWTGEGVAALKQLINNYGSNLTNAQLQSLYSDLNSMQGFLNAGQDSYAIGPGLTGSRAGNTGYGWQAASPSVTAMPSIYGTLGVDPLGISIITPSTQKLHFHVVDAYGTEDYYVTITNGIASVAADELDNWNQAGLYPIATGQGKVNGSQVLLSLTTALQSVLIDLKSMSVVWVNHMTGLVPIISQTVSSW